MSAFLNKENVTNLIKENTFLKGGGSCIYLKFQIFLSLFLINRDWFQWSTSFGIFNNEN